MVVGTVRTVHVYINWHAMDDPYRAFVKLDG